MKKFTLCILVASTLFVCARNAHAQVANGIAVPLNDTGTIPVYDDSNVYQLSVAPMFVVMEGGNPFIVGEVGGEGASGLHNGDIYWLDIIHTRTNVNQVTGPNHWSIRWIDKNCVDTTTVPGTINGIVPWQGTDTWAFWANHRRYSSGFTMNPNFDGAYRLYGDGNASPSNIPGSRDGFGVLVGPSLKTYLLVSRTAQPSPSGKSGTGSGYCAMPGGYGALNELVFMQVDSF